MHDNFSLVTAEAFTFMLRIFLSYSVDPSRLRHHNHQLFLYIYQKGFVFWCAHKRKVSYFFADPCLLAAPMFEGNLHAIKIAGTLSENNFFLQYTQDVKADARNAPRNFSSRFLNEIEIFSC